MVARKGSRATAKAQQQAQAAETMTLPQTMAQGRKSIWATVRPVISPQVPDYPASSRRSMAAR